MRYTLCPSCRTSYPAECAVCATNLYLADKEGENQASIVAWQKATFGLTTKQAAFRRMQDEFKELGDLVTLVSGRNCYSASDVDYVASEIADVYITLCRVADELGVDIASAVDAKMLINRAREWHVNPDGTGQHK